MKRKNTGVTLIEILISLTILVLVAGALSTGTNYLTRRVVDSEASAIARNLAWVRLERVKAEPLFLGHRSGIFGREFAEYSFSEDIKKAKVKNQSINDLYCLNLKVMWERGFDKGSIDLETYFRAQPLEKQTGEKNGQGNEK
jgi:prepilin-type N-terminal cleavage/methylation domain-containing protein